MGRRTKAKSPAKQTSNRVGPKLVAGLRLKPHWRSIAARAWSIRFMAIAAILSGFEAAFGMVGPYLPVSNAWLAGLTFLLVAAGCVSRLIAQQNLQEEC